MLKTNVARLERRLGAIGSITGASEMIFPKLKQQ
jgi:hypothetical protein